MTRSLLISALTAYLFVLLAITLAFPGPREMDLDERLILSPFESISRDWSRGGRGLWVNVVGNVVVFTPLGAAFVALGGPRATLVRAAVTGGLLSATIESLQFLSARRFTDIDDVILNTLGTVVGYLAADALRRAWRAWAGREPS